jgi:hypothetical protein
MLIDLKNKPAKTKPKDAIQLASPMSDEYPYGLRITLNGDQVNELGLKGVKAGETLKIMGEVRVKEVTDRDPGKGEDQSNTGRVELQIEKLEPFSDETSELETEFGKGADEED